MALTLLVVVASQFPRVRDDIDQIAGVIPIYVAFLVIMARRRAARPGAALRRARRGALLFTGATRNSLVVLPLALALGDDYALTPRSIVTQTLVEVLGMVRLRARGTAAGARGGASIGILCPARRQSSPTRSTAHSAMSLLWTKADSKGGEKRRKAPLSLASQAVATAVMDAQNRRAVQPCPGFSVAQI